MTDFAADAAATLFTMSRAGPSAVVRLICPAISDHEAQALEVGLNPVADRVGGRLAVGLAGVGRFTCAWINVLLKLSHRCDGLGGRLVLFGLEKEGRKLLRSTGLAKHLVIADNETLAVELTGNAAISGWRLALSKVLPLPALTPARASTAA